MLMGSPSSAGQTIAAVQHDVPALDHHKDESSRKKRVLHDSHDQTANESGAVPGPVWKNLLFAGEYLNVIVFDFAVENVANAPEST